MKDDSLAAFYALLGMSEEAPVTLARLDVRDWGQTLVFQGKASGAVGAQPFELVYSDCREMRWRVYVANPAAETPLVSFAAGRDQQRSPAQFLTAHFGLSLYYGSLEIRKS
jgi:hypothetical protein